MKPVSLAYKISMSKPFRSYSDVRIVIENEGNKIVFDGNQITGLRKISDVDPISRKLPTENVSFTVLDPFGKFDTNSPYSTDADDIVGANVSVSFGYYVGSSWEWISPDIYTVSQKPTYKSGESSFQAVKKLSTLTKKYYKGIFSYSQFSYWALAYRVLIDAGLKSDEFVLDDFLKNYSTSTPIPVDSHKNCLQMIAHACGCAVFSDSKNRICIKKIDILNPVSEDFKLRRMDVVNGSETIKKTDPLYQCAATCYSYQAEPETRVLYSSEISENLQPRYMAEYAASTNVRVYLNDSPIEADVFSRVSEFSVPSGDFSIEIKGNKLQTDSSIYTKNVTSDSSFRNENINNALVTDHSVCAILAENTAECYMRRRFSELSYRGNPELEPLDVIMYTTPYKMIQEPCMVLRSEIVFDGAISGNLKLWFLKVSGGKALLDKEGAEILDNNGLKIKTREQKSIRANYTAAEINQFIKGVMFDGTS